MSFLSVFVHNTVSIVVSLVYVVFVGMAVLKILPANPRKYGLCRIALATVCKVSVILLATVFYKKGLLAYIFNNILLAYVLLIGNALCVCLVFREKFRRCWGITLFTQIIVEYSGTLSFLIFTDRPLVLNIPEERRVYMLVNYGVGPGVFFLLLYLLYKMKIGDAYRRWLEHGEFWSRGMICLSAYPILFYGATDLLMGSGVSRNVSWGITLLMLFAALVLFHHMGMEEWQRREFASQQIILQQQDVYIKTLEGMQEEMRRFRHDYKNMMSGLYLTAREGELAKTHCFIQEMTEDFDSQIGDRIRQMGQLGNVCMTEVKGLLLTKLVQMQRDGTVCELEVMHPFRGTRCRITDLCRCLGILIDNAMEEVRGREDARVHIMISSQGGYTTFRVKNRLYHTVDVHEIWQRGYSTKGADRGLGLASYRKILAGYEDVLPATAVQEGYFIQEFKVREQNGK
ncbi:sensor histidine kinase [uncultured Acetatifactor sp.]|uniref:sensor histidine kinase n=1 Tax=uncultured Acetatifactor sp. TaxID=1671927 RepID=UPI002605EEC5|nr:GHKL domain-containing protein [uncultured Acetatifactor sp.]